MVRTGFTLVAMAVGLGAFATLVVVSRLDVDLLGEADVFLGDAIFFCCYGGPEATVVKSVN